MGMKMNFDTEYIHYGADEYDPKLTRQNGLGVNWTKISIGKPNGLWASPVKSESGWKNWCEDNDYCTDRLTKYFKFKLKNGAKILEIREFSDILDYFVKSKHGWLVWINGDCYNAYLNSKKLIENFDGMELYLSENWQLRDQYFYTWDCDSICIWNPDVVETIKEKEKE